jgi:hypothetical protein
MSPVPQGIGGAGCQAGRGVGKGEVSADSRGPEPIVLLGGKGNGVPHVLPGANASSIGVCFSNFFWLNCGVYRLGPRTSYQMKGIAPGIKVSNG